MTESIIIRNRALDETVNYHKKHVKTKSEKHSSKSEQTLLATYHSYEEAERINFDLMPIFAVRISIPGSTVSQTGFELRYVCAPDWKSARASYLAWLKSFYTKDELKNRKKEHKAATGTSDYWSHCSVKRVW